MIDSSKNLMKMIGLLHLNKLTEVHYKLDVGNQKRIFKLMSKITTDCGLQGLDFGEQVRNK